MTEEKIAPSTEKSHFVDLHPRDIIQINATIVAGALILLTLGNILSPENNKYFPYLITLLTIAVIMPFVLSSVLALQENKTTESKKMMQKGFLVLMLGLLALAAIVFPGWGDLAKLFSR